MTSQSYQRGNWQPKNTPSLPGINEMFPEHFMKYTPNVRFVLKEQDPRLRIDIPGQSMQQPQYPPAQTSRYPQSPTVSRQSPHPAQSPVYSTSTRHSESSTSPPPSSSNESSDKKHVCPTCSKRFSRPSSLRIHVNTHTGETPFRCPYPGCGREFNVNSNMRRHYRNHGATGGLTPPLDDVDDESLPPTPNPSQHHHWSTDPARQINNYPIANSRALGRW
ncbi:c2h2 conidiation transcription factor [Moniliophthora roreri]|uniref:C2H2-type domain-containing protein n=1 Tax=Moniliophthora roreri TaxID=221103 RepID=A0A0W0EU12_MONRR|nr:c2h2 conidiation transcription factor [Moniliophthora roreri]